MILKNISFLESHLYSAWPKRLIGLTEWQKKERNSGEILEEYNNYWYKKALTLWQDLSKSNKNIRPERFFRMLEQVIYDGILQNPQVYGVTKDELLVSINQELFTTNWSVINALYDNLIVDVIGKYIKQTNAKVIVEMGCGAGGNLFKAYEKLPINQIIGGEICSNAIALGNDIVEKCHIPGSFKQFDYYQENSIADLVSNINEKYILFTSHSIEQIQLKKTNLVEQIKNLPHKPEVIIHFEPILDHEDSSLMTELHHQYANKNLYNMDLVDVMSGHEKNKQIEIVEFQKNILGMCAFNPTSVFVWKCSKG